MKSTHENLLQPTFLFSVVITFADHTNCIEQYKVASPQDATAMFIREAKCLEHMAVSERAAVNASHIEL